MASSNRHWPSMFKSKPCNTHHNQWQHDITPATLMSTSCHRSSYTSVPGCEERSPEPKPRWNPKPEQIRILEAIFNSGMVNPPREEIRRIRTQLQEYGQVGDANVFYWFQNRKSRSKHKLRLLQNSKQQQTPPPITSSSSSSFSSSSEKSSPAVKESNYNNKSTLSLNTLSSPSSATVNSLNQQTYLQPYNEFLTEPFFFPVHQQTGGGGGGFSTQGFGFSELTNVIHVLDHQQPAAVGPCTSLLLSEIMKHGANNSKRDHHEEKMKILHPQLSYSTLTTTTHTIPPPTAPLTVPSTIPNQIQGVGESEGGVVSPGGAARSTVFINDVAFEVAVGPLNIREAFGEDAVLINSSGQPVLTNEWGVTLQSLQNGAFYYLI